MSRKDSVTVDDVWRVTRNGYDIFDKELGGVPIGNICSPLRTGDNSPSFSVYQYNGIWFCKDYGGDQFCGNAIQFIQKKYNISFYNALQKILRGNNLRLFNKESSKKIIHVNKDVSLIEFSDMPFDKNHASYWNAYHLPEDFLRKKNVFQVKSWAINKKKQDKLEGELTFAYYAPDIDKTKILRINVDSSLKWRSGMTNSYLWNYWNYNRKVEDMFICKSYKDEMVMSYLGYDTISLQNESARILLENNVEKINKISSNPIMLLGTDPQGKETSIEVTKKTGWSWFNTKNHLYEKYNIVDPADFVKSFNMKQLDNLVRLKNFKYGILNKVTDK